MADDKRNVKQETQDATAPVEGEVIAPAPVEGEVMDEGNVIKLSKPMNGRAEIVLDFDKITGAMLLKCEKKAKETDSSIIVPQLSMTFQAHVAAAAVGARYDDIINLAGPDFMAVTLKVSRFLNGAE